MLLKVETFLSSFEKSELIVTLFDTPTSEASRIFVSIKRRTASRDVVFVRITLILFISVTMESKS